MNRRNVTVRAWELREGDPVLVDGKIRGISELTREEDAYGYGEGTVVRAKFGDGTRWWWDEDETATLCLHQVEGERGWKTK